jgi:hypothetical protein
MRKEPNNNLPLLFGRRGGFNAYGAIGALTGSSGSSVIPFPSGCLDDGVASDVTRRLEPRA